MLTATKTELVACREDNWLSAAALCAAAGPDRKRLRYSHTALPIGYSVVETMRSLVPVR
jgi:hypothetical protein